MRAGEQVMAVPCACTSVRATCATFFRKPVHSLAFSPTATSMKYCPRCASGSRLRDGRADVAVHSLKDVPMDMPTGFTLAAIMAREDPRDAFVSNMYRALRELPAGSVVGTSSLRREAQLRERYSAIKVESLRGNVNTRLRKLDEGRYAAVILAAAGLKRLGLGERIVTLLDPADSLPAVGQGALALECRADRT